MSDRRQRGELHLLRIADPQPHQPIPQRGRHATQQARRDRVLARPGRPSHEHVLPQRAETELVAVLVLTDVDVGEVHRIHRLGHLRGVDDLGERLRALHDQRDHHRLDPLDGHPLRLQRLGQLRKFGLEVPQVLTLDQLDEQRLHVR